MATDSEDFSDGRGYTVDYTDMIGHGGYGFVYKATNRHGDVSVAKIISCKDTSKHEMEEVQNCYKLKFEHPNIITIFDVIKDDNNIYIFMEYCEFGNLRTFFAQRELTTREKVELMTQIANGMAHLHMNGIIHRDLKPENLLVTIGQDSSPRIKLGDFAVSKYIEEGQHSTMSSDVGTAAFKAPEFWQRDRDGRLHYKRSVDVFAAGLVFLAMLQTDTEKKMAPGIEVPGSLDPDECENPLGYTMYVRMKNNIEIPNIIATEGDEMTLRVKTLIKQMINVLPDDRVNTEIIKLTLSDILDGMKV